MLLVVTLLDIFTFYCNNRVKSDMKQISNTPISILLKHKYKFNIQCYILLCDNGQM